MIHVEDHAAYCRMAREIIICTRRYNPGTLLLIVSFLLYNTVVVMIMASKMYFE